MTRLKKVHNNLGLSGLRRPFFLSQANKIDS